MCRHAGKRQCSGGLHHDSSAPLGCPEGVPPEIIAKAWGSNKIRDGVARVVRVGEIEGAGHGLKAKRVVVHVHRCKGDGVAAIFRGPFGGRLDNIQHLKESLKGR